ncbi:effector binding domain-containing protein [Paenibacillus sp. FSL K6-1566]|uniref:GyrI-like domain-containing protein n=1 Tax=Paenibacillus sp. FSL K6-1566 TaxID=2954515 RepID=UPI003100CBD5
MNTNIGSQKKRRIESRPAMSVWGAGARTTNEAEAGANGVIPRLWEYYFRKGIKEVADSGQAVYAVYTDYESDASGAYTLVIGHETEGIFGDGQGSEEVEHVKRTESQSVESIESTESVKNLNRAGSADGAKREEEGTIVERSVFIPESRYLVFPAKPGPFQETVPQAWQEIWSYFQNAEEVRAYSGDFEHYRFQAADPAHPVVEIYIAIK